MYDDVRGVISGRVQSPEGVVDSQRQPGEGDVVPGERRRDHPAQVRGTQPAVLHVLGEVQTIVPVDEVVAEGYGEHDRSGCGEAERYEDDCAPGWHEDPTGRRHGGVENPAMA